MLATNKIVEKGKHKIPKRSFRFEIGVGDRFARETRVVGILPLTSAD